MQNIPATIEVRGMAPLLQVFDMPTSIAFYRDTLGFPIDPDWPIQHDDIDWVMFRVNNVQVMLNTAYEKPERPAQPDPARVAAHRDTAIYFGCPDIDGAYGYFKARGVMLEPPMITHYGFKSITIIDPDGYYLVFQWPVNNT